MTPTLRGNGHYKKLFLMDIYGKYGNSEFTFKDVSDLPNFANRVFIRLQQDGLIVPAKKTIPVLWQLNARSLEMCATAAECEDTPSQNYSRTWKLLSLAYQIGTLTERSLSQCFGKIREVITPGELPNNNVRKIRSYSGKPCNSRSVWQK
jgi:hypothetical protein